MSLGVYSAYNPYAAYGYPARGAWPQGWGTASPMTAAWGPQNGYFGSPVSQGPQPLMVRKLPWTKQKLSRHLRGMYKAWMKGQPFPEPFRVLVLLKQPVDNSLKQVLGKLGLTDITTGKVPGVTGPMIKGVLTINRLGTIARLPLVRAMGFQGFVNEK